MQVEIFQANGYKEIDELEDEINAWSDAQKWAHTQRSIKFVKTAMCQVADSPSGERIQHYVVSVWYA